jgi:hypothetical protein
VIDRLRAFLHRPLDDRDRLRLFLLAVAAIALGAAVLALIGDPSASQPARHQVDRSGEPDTTQRQPVPAAALELPSEEGRQTGAVGSHSDVEAAKAAARRFLSGYLRYSYGQAEARHIDAAADELRRRLASDPPRVPPGEQARRPHVLLLHADGAGPVRAAIVALVSDGARRYTVRLELEQRRSGWIVVDVGS